MADSTWTGVLCIYCRFGAPVSLVSLEAQGLFGIRRNPAVEDKQDAYHREKPLLSLGILWHNPGFTVCSVIAGG